MADYDNNLSIMLLPVHSENTAAPVLRGLLEVDGTKYKVSLWLNKKLEDKVEEDDASYIREAFDYMRSLGINCLLQGKLEVDDREQNTAPAKGKRTPPTKGSF